MFYKMRLGISVLATLVFVVLSWEALAELVRRWSLEPEYGHGWLIPLISAYLCAQCRSQLSLSPPSFSAVVLLALASICVAGGLISGLFLLVQCALVLVIFALVGLWFGLQGIKQLLWPVGLLVFCIPLPYVIEVAFTAKLQLLSSRIAVSLIESMGIVVFLSGNVIDLGVIKLQVVEACSGLRYLYPLMSLGYLAAYFYRGPLWIRWLVFIATVPITVLLNSVRIASMAWLAENFGLKIAEGFFHDFEGWLIFACCMALLAALLWCLNALFTRQSIWQLLGAPCALDNNTGSIKSGSSSQAVYVLGASAAIVMIAWAGGYGIVHRPQVAPPAAVMASFPLRWGDWTGVSRPLSSAVTDSLGVDDHLFIDFVSSSSSAPVNFYVAYYKNQRAGQSPHSPKVCIPGGGWQIETIERITLEGKRFNRVVIVRQGEKQLVYYGFVERGEWVADEYFRKWLLLKDFLLFGRSDGALVRLTTPVHPRETLNDADLRLKQILKPLSVGITAYLPARPL